MTAELGNPLRPARTGFQFSSNTATTDPVDRASAVSSAPRRRRGRNRRLKVATVLLTADLVAFTGATLMSSIVNLRTVVVLAVVVALFQAGGLYRLRLCLSMLDDAPALVGRAFVAGAMSMVFVGFRDGSAGTSRLLSCLIFGGLCLVTRSLAYAVIRFARRRHRLRQRTLLLGAGRVAGELAANLREHPEYGLKPVGMLDGDPLLGEEDRCVPLLGSHEDLTRVVLEHRVEVVIVTYSSMREPLMVSLLRTCDRLACEIYFVPRLYEVHAVTRDTEVLWGLPLVRMRRAPFRTGAWTAKRVSDVAMAGTALLLLAPVLLICAVLARWETGTVLFRQTRVGLDGRPFTLLKFCSLRPSGEAESGTHWNIGEDERVRPVARFLRRTSFDELPQLWNVVRGDMSMVGPRPERPFFVGEFSQQFPWYQARHRVPVGLTGWAQVHGLRGDTSIADRARFDNFYIENWSLWGDIKILMRTFGQVLRAAGR